VVLACTHYPAIAEQIQKILPNARLLDPSMSTALFVQKNWKFTKRKTAKQIFMTSGSRSQMIKSASLAFDVQIKKLEAYY
jgi:glutamate racemase